MSPELSIIEGPYLRDILEQPEALRRTVRHIENDRFFITSVRGLEPDRFRRIVLTGMGSSYHGLYPLHLALSNHGLPSLWVETSEFIHAMPGLLDPRTLVIAVSQSGESAEIVRLLEMNAGRAKVIGITNSAHSTLACQAAVRLVTQAGAEATVSCKTYLAGLAALEWLGAILTGRDLRKTKDALDAAAPAVEAYLGDWKAYVSTLSEMLAGIDRLFITGRGPSLAAAGTAGLTLKESTRFAVEGMGCAAFRHGPFEVISSNVFVAVLAGDFKLAPLNRRLVEDVRVAGGSAVLVSAQAPERAFRIPEVPDSMLPVVEILPMQMISLALAALKGQEAGRFSIASKVTAVE